MQKPLEQLDPDIRFLLANERTLLAWIRTSLTLQAGGLALAQLHRSQHSNLLGIGILLLGGSMAVMGYLRFRAADRAIRNHHLPPLGHGPALQVIAVVIVAIGLAIAQFTVLR